MDATTWILIFVVLAASVGGAVYFYRTRKKEMNQLFDHVFEMAKQVPHQKKLGFILLMFKESVRAAKSKKSNPPHRINDPKQLEVQLLQMSSILKDRSKVKDKQMKQALQMLDSYLAWEKAKTTHTGSARKAG